MKSYNYKRPGYNEFSKILNIIIAKNFDERILHRRKYQRFEVYDARSIKILVFSNTLIIEAFLKNISRGGLAIATKGCPPQLNKDKLVQLKIICGDNSYTTNAKVVHVAPEVFNNIHPSTHMESVIDRREV